MSYRRRRGLGGTGTSGSGNAGRRDGPGETGEARPGAGRRRALISASAVVGALLIGYGVAALWLFPSEASAGDASVVTVPDVVGLAQAEARSLVVEAGLEFTVGGGMDHREAPEGTVLAQSPLAGQFARPGAPVEAVLSRGPEMHTLPDVAGLSERQAGIVLERLGYEVEIESREDPTPAGRAVETRPPAGTELPVPSRLVLVVSEGAPIVVVPDLRGMHVDDAVRILADVGLELGSISFDPGAVEAPGRIVGQYPPEGYSLRAGDSVELRVAGSPDDVNRGEGSRADGPRGDDPSRDARRASSDEEPELL